MEEENAPSGIHFSMYSSRDAAYVPVASFHPASELETVCPCWWAMLQATSPAATVGVQDGHAVVDIRAIPELVRSGIAKLRPRRLWEASQLFFALVRHDAAAGWREALRAVLAWRKQGKGGGDDAEEEENKLVVNEWLSPIRMAAAVGASPEWYRRMNEYYAGQDAVYYPSEGAGAVASFLELASRHGMPDLVRSTVDDVLPVVLAPDGSTWGAAAPVPRADRVRIAGALAGIYEAVPPATCALVLGVPSWPAEAAPVKPEQLRLLTSIACHACAKGLREDEEEEGEEDDKEEGAAAAPALAAPSPSLPAEVGTAMGMGQPMAMWLGMGLRAGCYLSSPARASRLLQVAATMQDDALAAVARAMVDACNAGVEGADVALGTGLAQCLDGLPPEAKTRAAKAIYQRASQASSFCPTAVSHIVMYRLLGPDDLHVMDVIAMVSRALHHVDAARQAGAGSEEEGAAYIQRVADMVDACQTLAGGVRAVIGTVHELRKRNGANGAASAAAAVRACRARLKHMYAHAADRASYPPDCPPLLDVLVASGLGQAALELFEFMFGDGNHEAWQAPTMDTIRLCVYHDAAPVVHRVMAMRPAWWEHRAFIEAVDYAACCLSRATLHVLATEGPDTLAAIAAPHSSSSSSSSSSSVQNQRMPRPRPRPREPFHILRRPDGRDQQYSIGFRRLQQQQQQQPVYRRGN